MTEPVDVVRLRDGLSIPVRESGRWHLPLAIPVYADDGAIIPIRQINEALLAYLQRLTDAVERVEASQQALHDRLDTLERAWKARGSL